MTDKEVMQMALDVLEYNQANWQGKDKALEGIRAALAQPEPEPIAYFDPQKKGFYWAHPTKINAPVSVKVDPLALYAALPKSECSCAECGKKASDGWALYCVDCGEILATAIAEETKKREKNGY